MIIFCVYDSVLLVMDKCLDFILSLFKKQNKIYRIALNYFMHRRNSKFNSGLSSLKCNWVQFPQNYINLIKDHDAVRLISNIFDFTNVYGEEDERDLNFLSFKSNHLDGDILSNQENINDVDNY